MICAFSIRHQTDADIPLITALHEISFGPGRFARTAFRIREASTMPPPIALTAWCGNELAGAIQFTPVTIGETSGAMLLGPLVIAPEFKNRGCGLMLMRQGLQTAEDMGARLVILIGDQPYYGRVGFRVIPSGQVILPGPADPARFLALELEPEALKAYSGLVAADNALRVSTTPSAQNATPDRVLANATANG